MLRLARKYHGITCNFRLIILAFIWVVSLLCGVLYSARHQSVVVLMRLILSFQVSIVGVLFASILPFLITIYCSSNVKLFLIYTLCFFRGFLVGYAICALTITYGTGGWLVYMLSSFSSAISNLLLLLLWFYELNKSSFHIRNLRIVAALLAVVFSAIDYLFVSPFTATLII